MKAARPGISKEKLDAIVDGTNKLVDHLRASNEEGERTKGHPPMEEDKYETLRFELIMKSLKMASYR